MEFDVASARRVGERWGASDAKVGAAAAGVLLLQACDEIERLLKLMNRAADDLSDLQSENRRLRALCGLPATGKLPELES